MVLAPLINLIIASLNLPEQLRKEAPYDGLSYDTVNLEVGEHMRLQSNAPTD